MFDCRRRAEYVRRHRADHHGVRLLGEAELEQLLNETPLEDITTSYSLTGHDPDEYVGPESLGLGPIALPESLRRILSIIWDYNGRPKPQVALGTIASVEKKLGHQLPRTLVAYMLAAHGDPKTAFGGISARSIPPFDEYVAELAQYVPDGFLRIPFSGAALPDGKGNEVGCEFLFLQGLESNVILRKIWDHDHEGEFEIELEEDFPVYEVEADKYDLACCPAIVLYEKRGTAHMDLRVT